MDVALAMHMLYHVPDIPAAVRELRRSTRPVGTVLASTNGTGSLSEVWISAISARQMNHAEQPPD